MPDALKQRINDDVKGALRAGDKKRLGALRLILAAIKQREVDERITLDDSQIVTVLDKMAKQRQESIEIYTRGARLDLADQESFELELIQSYMPAPLRAEELSELLERAIAQAGAVGVKDMGKMMAILKPLVQGRADMSALSSVVRRRLSS